MKLKDALEGYWLEKRRNLSKHTVSDYQLTFRRFTVFVGDDIEFDKITATHVRVFLEDMKEGGLAAKSVLNCWTALSSLWTWAENELGAKHVIRGKVQKPRIRRGVIEPYSRQEVASLLNACANNAIWYGRATGKAVQSERPEKMRDRAIILTLLDTGLRAQELCNLRMKSSSLRSLRRCVKAVAVLERGAGIEPASALGWSAVLPLNDPHLLPDAPRPQQRAHRVRHV